MAVIVPQVLSTISDVMQFIAPNAGGTVPETNSAEYVTWLGAIQVKYEEAARRGFWRRLLVKDTLDLREGDETAVLPTQFQRPNALYILAIGGEDLADPDRITDSDSQTVFVQQITDPDDEDFGLWQANFKNPIEADEEAIIWYFALPPKPTDGDDRLLLPGDMVAFGAMSEIFRSTNLEGSQDDARTEYENRLTNYLASEMIPPRNELVTFTTNPKRINRTALARRQYYGTRNRYGGR
jgi:hypothetical protein